MQYKLNERAVGWEQYNKKLEQYNILVKARNFLVFQVGAASPEPPLRPRLAVVKPCGCAAPGVCIRAGPGQPACLAAAYLLGRLPAYWPQHCSP